MYKRSNIVKLNKKTICLIITLLSITLIASIVFTNKNNSKKKQKQKKKKKKKKQKKKKKKN